MSTQHIEEADELATQVCIMSHGHIVVQDVPAEIKRKFGVGYTLIVEWDGPEYNQKESLESARDLA